MRSRNFALLLFLCLGIGVAHASGHGPVFGLATPTNSQGEWSFDLALAARRATETEFGSRSMITYGFTPHFQLSLSLPGVLNTAAVAPSRSMSGDLETNLGWRFHRSSPSIGTRFESTLFVGAILPELRRSPGMMGQLRRAPGFFGSVATGMASRGHYVWAGGGYLRSTERGGDQRPHVGNWSFVYGYRPARWRRDYPSWDWRLFAEVVGEHWNAVRHNGAEVPGSDGYQILAGPTTLGIYKTFAVSGGILFPLRSRPGAVFPKERYRATLNLSYFLFTHGDDHD
jgi:hypothetical protein